MRRRLFLTGLASAACRAAVGGIPTPSTTRAPSPATARPATATPAPPTASAPDWDRLRAAMQGPLITDAAGLDRAGHLYNARFDGVHPVAVAGCAAVEDVQACVRFSTANGVPLALRSGGHSYGGWSIGTGLVVDVTPMATVTVTGGTASVGAGARLVDVYDAVAAKGRGIAAGSCPTVGIAGLTLCGGLGVLSRAWGLACDQLLAADIVTADGTHRRCDAAAEPDLFWALRGAGAGSFGVVTNLVFATRPAGDIGLLFASWDPARAPAVLAGWQVWMRDAAPALWSTVHLEGGEGVRSLTVHAVLPGPATPMRDELDRLVGTIGIPPAYREWGARTFRDAMLLEAGCLDRSVSACHLRGTTPDGQLERAAFAATSLVADTALSGPAIASLVGSVERASTGSAAVLIDTLGGAAGAIAADATAFPHRGAFAVVQLYTSWPSAASGDRSRAWLRAAAADARPLIGPGAYAGYADPDLPDFAAAYWGRNVERLRSVKRRYDPDRVFDFPQAVRP